MSQGIIFDNFCFTQASVVPGTISANTSAAITVSMPGLRTSDLIICVVKPTLTAGIDTGNAFVSANNTASIVFQNSTASGIAVPTETYSFLICRPEKVLGGPDALSGGSVIFK